MDATGSSKAMIWTGRVISALVVAAMTMSASMKLLTPDKMAEGMEHLGWPMAMATTLGVLELTSTILYALPWTAMLGAILLTGYMGGTIATHVRIGDPVYTQVIIGVLVWGGLFFRDARIRALIPIRK